MQPGQDPDTLPAEAAVVQRLVDGHREFLAFLQARVASREVAEVASGLGITANNATVRLRRAPQALKRQLARSCGTCSTHGCLDCSCG